MSKQEEPTPYADTREHLLEELNRAELLLRRHVESLWNDPDAREQEGYGFYVSDQEVDRLLATGRDVARAHVDDRTSAGSHGPSVDETKEGLQSLTRFVRRRVSRSREVGVDLRLDSLAREFELSPLEVDVVLLVLGPDLDRTFERVYGYLHDDITNPRPTVGLLLRVLAGSEPDRLSLFEVFADRSTLVRDRLIEVIDGPTRPSSSVRVRPRVIEYLLGSDAIADPIVDAVELIDAEEDSEARESIADLPLDDDRRRKLTELSDRLGKPCTKKTGGRSGPEDARESSRSESHDVWYGSARDEPPDPLERDISGSEGGDLPMVAAFVGPDQRMAEAAVASVCADAETPILRVNARSLSPDAVEEDFAVVRREARLQQAVVHLTTSGALEADGHSPRTSAGTVDEPEHEGRSALGIDRLVVGLDAFGGDVFLSGDVPFSARLQPRFDCHDVVRVEFPRPDFDQRRALWEAIEGLPSDTDPATLAGTFRLTRGEIEDAASTARSLAGGTLTAEAIREACAIHARPDLDELAREVDPTYDWDDIVLPDDTLGHLREVAAGIRHRGTVYEEWGFAERFSLGNGINLLFTGPSGTGKTMAAEIIAGDVGLPLYKLDLSSIMSKYIGETEKNLRRVFDAAEHSNAILFFDEADALFGKRTEIGDSRDRYANVEVDYLLQRMEEHDGCVILASNLKENIDDAFHRRINAIIGFPMPDEDARAAIWESIFPAETPTGEINVGFLAEFELSGGAIKSVALTAAFMAAEEGEDVGMDHLVRAVRREFQKTGKLYELDSFGEYRDALE